MFHIADAPGHGDDINGKSDGGFSFFGGDRYPNGSPDGYKIQNQMRAFAAEQINFTFVKVNEGCNAMIKVMQENFDRSGLKMNVTDLASAC